MSTKDKLVNPMTGAGAGATDYQAAKARLVTAGYRAFCGANGWYIALVGPDGSHGYDDHGETSEAAAWGERLAYARWAWASDKAEGGGK